MVQSKNIAIVIVLTITAFSLLSFAPHTKKVKADKGFAVVELFTSEGCSSCSPADDLIARIQKESNDKPVYILAFHVERKQKLYV